MAQAGYCSICEETVWLAPDGSCMKGHAPEFISGVYDVTESAQPIEPEYPEVPFVAAPQTASQHSEPGYTPQVVPTAASSPATPVAPAERRYITPTPDPAPPRKTGVIVLIVVIVAVVLCGCCAAGAYIFITTNEGVTSFLPSRAPADSAAAAACAANQAALEAAAQAWQATVPGADLGTLDSMDAAGAALGSLVTDFDSVATCPGGGELSVTDGAFTCSIPEHNR